MVGEGEEGGTDLEGKNGLLEGLGSRIGWRGVECTGSGGVMGDECTVGIGVWSRGGFWGVGREREIAIDGREDVFGGGSRCCQ
jgi:hypothetical protein